MDRDDALDRYKQWAWDRVEETEFPSPPMLDRLERQLRSREDAEAYLDLLFEKAPGSYPSGQIMARIERMTDLLRLARALEEQGAAAG